jgi:fructoselysine-6-P-deglycase FrlB-like protein
MSETLREIASQPDLWRRAAHDAPLHRDTLAAPGEKVLAIGCGTSAFVAMAYAALREDAGLGWTDAAFASELPRTSGYDRVVALTRSGTTTEVLEALESVTGSRRVVVTAVPEPVAAHADDLVVLDWADERSVVQTRFPTTLLALVRACFGQQVDGAVEQLEQLLAAPLSVDVGEFEHHVALGHGWTVGLAHEAALKIRESAQAWAESYPALDYRHGPVAVAGPGSLVQFLGPAPAGLADDIAATGATVLADDRDPLVQLVRAQLVALALAERRGLDPDNPRHLTRSVVLSHSSKLEA